MDYTNMDLKFSYPDHRFQMKHEVKKSESVKVLMQSEMLTKRTPKCARLELIIKLLVL